MGKLKRLGWVGASRREYLAFPEVVQDVFGFALYRVQCGETPRAAKPLKGLGGGVLELRGDDRDGTYRAVYTVRFGTTVYVLHAFQKKSKTGIATPKRHIEIVKSRLRAAEAHHRAGKQGETGDE